MELSYLNTAHFNSTFLTALEAGIPRHKEIDYAGLFATCTERAMHGWQTHIIPEFAGDIEYFNKALWRLRMRPETAIPFPMAFGYALGAVSYELAGGEPEGREDAAITSGLALFLVGLFDHMLDKYPREFGDIGSRVDTEHMTRFTLERDLADLELAGEASLASSFLALYQVYFQRAHRLLGEGKSSPVAKYWHDSMQKMHEAERASLGWNISKVPPTAELVELVETPGSYSYWAVMLSACLGLDLSAIEKMEGPVKQFIRLSRLLDAVTDVEEEISNDIWGGMTVRLALETGTQEEADKLILTTAAECVAIWQSLEPGFAAYMWSEEDDFTLADVLWAYLWTWAGGEVKGLGEKLDGQGQVIEETVC